MLIKLNVLRNFNKEKQLSMYKAKTIFDSLCDTGFMLIVRVQNLSTLFSLVDILTCKVGQSYKIL